MSLLGAFWRAKGVKYIQADSEDSDQTVHMFEGTLSPVATRIEMK